MLKNIRFPWTALIIFTSWIAAVIATLIPGVSILLVLLTTFIITIIFALIGFHIPN